MNIILLIFAGEKILTSVDLSVPSLGVLFVGDKEVCQLEESDLQLRCYNSIFVSSPLLWNVWCYLRLLPCLDDTLNWLPFSMSLVPKHFQKRLSG